nr:MAG TPA: hypothetical protein [Caudoviricetes sp.]DAT48144.1 MAG TPA: hypothetical protein [Caudoviricetes sp.]
MGFAILKTVKKEADAKGQPLQRKASGRAATNHY